MKKKQAVSLLLLFCIVFTNMMPIFQVEARAAENDYVIDMVNEDGEIIKDEVTIRCEESWGYFEDILITSKDGKLDLSILHEIDDQSFWRLSVDEPNIMKFLI